jgi:hypothetical protein
MCNILAEEPDGNRLLGNHRRGWQDNLKIDPEIGGQRLD